MDRSAAHPDYVKATDRLVRGDVRGALALLEGVESADSAPEVRLALAQAHLEAGSYPDALGWLEDPERLPADPRSRAYTDLLRAAALAGSGRPDDARELLDRVSGREPGLEGAARGLRRRIDAGEAPQVRF